MSFQADTRRHFELWRAEMLAAPDTVGPEQLTCPCGEQIVVRWGRNSERWMAYHSITQLWCQDSGATWYGATRAEAVANFRGSVEGLGLTPQSHPKGAFQEVPLKDRSGNQTPPPENSPQEGADRPLQLSPNSGPDSSESPELVKKNEAAGGDAQKAGAATIAGWEVSGLSDEAVNALLAREANP